MNPPDLSAVPVRATGTDKGPTITGVSRCERQVFGSVNVCNHVNSTSLRGQTRSDKHTRTSSIHKGTQAGLIFCKTNKSYLCLRFPLARITRT